MPLDLEKVREDAENIHRGAGFMCAEAVVYAVRKNFDPDMPESFIAAAGAFPFGTGCGCICGAIAGGELCLGYFFGRTKEHDPKVFHLQELTEELQNKFMAKNKVSCCKILTRGMDFETGEHKTQCISFSGFMAYETAKIIAREKNIETIN